MMIAGMIAEGYIIMSRHVSRHLRNLSGAPRPAARCQGGGGGCRPINNLVVPPGLADDLRDTSQLCLDADGTIKTVDKVFRDFDRDGSGYLDEAEFLRAMSRLRVGEEMAEELWAQADTGGDGQVWPWPWRGPVWRGVVAEIDYLCDVCSGREILRRGGGRGQVDLEEWTALWGQVRQVMAQA
jgi:hypothetical protein